ncbi:hypothetical protein ES708_28013 [subsurface metagenome]
MCNPCFGVIILSDEILQTSIRCLTKALLSERPPIRIIFPLGIIPFDRMFLKLSAEAL